jgi:hypothetical protein
MQSAETRLIASGKRRIGAFTIGWFCPLTAGRGARKASREPARAVERVAIFWTTIGAGGGTPQEQVRIVVGAPATAGGGVPLTIYHIAVLGPNRDVPPFSAGSAPTLW